MQRLRLLVALVVLCVAPAACEQGDPPAQPVANPGTVALAAERAPEPRANRAAIVPHPAPAPSQFDAADAVVSSVPLFDAPGSAQAVETLAHPAPFGVPLSFMVLDRQGDRLHVQVPTRPNQRTAWIRAADVTVRQVPNRVLVELGARRLTVFRGRTEEVLHQAPVAIGQPAYLTPVGDLFFVDAVVALANPGGVYGPYQLRISAFSEVLATFDGGPGQVAFHGTNSPQLIGLAVSHGCVRMTNDDVVRLAELAPVGTPVSIVP